MTAETVELLGVRFQRLTLRDAAAEIARLAGRSTRTYVVKPYSEFMPRAYRDETVREVLNGAELCLADGAGILWAASYLSLPGGGLRALLQLPLSLASLVFRLSALRVPLPEAMAGVDLTWEMLESLAGSGRSVFLLGGTAEESAAATQAVRERVPSLTIAGARDGYFRRADAEAVIEAINAASADVLLVAMGLSAPGEVDRQEPAPPERAGRRRRGWFALVHRRCDPPGAPLDAPFRTRVALPSAASARPSAAAAGATCLCLARPQAASPRRLRRRPRSHGRGHA